MTARIAVVEHEPDCPPAHVGTWLVEAGAEHVVQSLDELLTLVRREFPRS